MQVRNSYVPPWIWSLYAWVYPRKTLLWLSRWPPLCWSKHAIPVRTLHRALRLIRSCLIKFPFFCNWFPVSRSLARKHLKENEIPLSFTSFPRLGTPGVFTEPHFSPENAVSCHSLFLPQEISNPHARFPWVSVCLIYLSSLIARNWYWIILGRTLTANIRSRRGSKVAINLPIYPDTNTPKPFIDPTIPWDRNIYPEDPGKNTTSVIMKLSNG